MSDDCAWYYSYPESCGDWDDDDFNGADCCACGGGTTGQQSPVKTSTTPTSTQAACSDIDKLPKVTFIMYAGEGQTPARLTLHPRDYVLEFTVPVETQSVFLEEGLKAGTKHLASADVVNCADPANKADPKKCTKDCVIGIGPDNDPGWTLGQVFLRSFYTVFDRDTDRVGFIRNNPKANTGAPNPLEGSIQTTLLSSDGSKIGGNGNRSVILLCILANDIGISKTNLFLLIDDNIDFTISPKLITLGPPIS